MKKLIMFFALTLLVVSACKKDDDDNGSGVPDPMPDDPPKVRYFEYKSNDIQHRRDNILNDSLYSLDQAGNLFINLKENDGTRLLFYVTSFNGEQEYFDVYVQRDNDYGLLCVSDGGFVNIYKIDTLNNYMEGSFSAFCDATQEKDITEGVFLIDYFE